MSASIASPTEPLSIAPTEKTLKELLCLALGTPEVGAVNFNTLFILLNAMLQHTGLHNLSVEVLADQIPPPLSGTHSPDASERREQKSAGSERQVSSAESRLPTLIKSSKSVELLDRKVAEMEEKLLNIKTDLQQQPGDDHIADLKKKISNMENQLEILNTAPTDRDIISKSRSGTSMNPATDVWQQLQTQKKVEANESGVSRALSLLDELMRVMHDMKDNNDWLRTEIVKLGKKLQQEGDWGELFSRMEHVEAFEGRIDLLREEVDEIHGKLSQYPDPSEFESYITWPVLQEALTQHMEKMQNELGIPHGTDEDLGPIDDNESVASSRPLSSKLSSVKVKYPEATDILEQIGALTEKHSNLDTRVSDIEDILPTKQNKIDFDDLLKGMSRTELPSDLVEQFTKLKDALVLLEKEKDKLYEMLRVQQQTIDSILAMPHSGTTDGGESSGYESAGGPSAVSMLDIRKLEVTIQRMGQKLAGSIKQLQESDTELSKESKELKRAIDDLYNKFKDIRVQMLLLSDAQKALLAQQDDKDLKSAEEDVSTPATLTPKDSLETTRLTDTDPRPPTPPLSTRESSAYQRQPFKRTHKLQDADQITNLQNAILNLQAELDKLNRLVLAAMEEHDVKQQHIDALVGRMEKVEEEKADKENVKKEIEVKADKKSLATKVNRTDFDTTTDEISKNFNDILAKLLGLETDWQNANKQLSIEVEGKLDKNEMEFLKSQLESRLKAMRKLLDQRPVKEGFTEDDAAGFRKQLIQTYNCISCDRPVDMAPNGPVPSIPANPTLPANKSVRPYTSFELDQIRQQAKGMPPGRNAANFKAALEEREIARLRKLEELAFRTHFPPQGTYPPPDLQEMQSPQPPPQLQGENGDAVDSVVPSGRACGGNYTLTYPHRRYTRLTHLSELWQEEEAVLEVAREEVELQGHDGHIYRGRLPNMPAMLTGITSQNTGDSAYRPSIGNSPRPNSARMSTRTPTNVSRPQTTGNDRPHPPDHFPPHASPDHSAARVATPEA